MKYVSMKFVSNLAIGFSALFTALVFVPLVAMGVYTVISVITVAVVEFGLIGLLILPISIGGLFALSYIVGNWIGNMK